MIDEVGSPAHRLPSAGRKIVVVGGGIVGATIAFHVADRGAQVTVVDAGSPGEGETSRASFGWINAREKGPKAYHTLSRRSLDMWSRFAQRLEVDVGLQWGGQLIWTDTRERAGRMEKAVERQRKSGNPVRLLTRGEMKELEPGIHPGGFSIACWSEADGQVDVPRVVRACLDRVSALGGTVLGGTSATGFAKDDQGRVASVETGSGRLQCDTVVLACGPEAPAVSALAGLEVPVHHTAGTTAVTTPISPIFQRVTVAHAPTGLHLRQLKDGSVMFGGFPCEDADEEAPRWLKSAAELFPGLAEARILEICRARRPVPRDEKSILGFTTTCPNLYVASTHSGVTLAPVIGELAAIEILDCVQVNLLSAFRLDRFT